MALSAAVTAKLTGKHKRPRTRKPAVPEGGEKPKVIARRSKLREIEPETLTPSVQPDAKAQPLAEWLPHFLEFISHMVIESKETGQTVLGAGLWGSQHRALTQLAVGLGRGVRSFTYLKSRQIGVSTIFLAVDLFWLFMHPGINGVLVTDDEGNRDKFRLILRQYSRGLPRNMRYEIVDDNKSFMSWNVRGKLSVLDFLVAGKRKGSSLGTSRAYRFAHLTEVAKYGDERGLESFLQTLSENHPDRLFIYESTAEGFNHYYRMWGSAKADRETQMAIFIGWWSRENQKIEKDDPRYKRYMDDPWDEEESELREIVAREYGVMVTDEQLAWYRWRAQTRSLDEGMMMQEQPWHERQAFILSGRSFFPLRKVERDLAVVQDGKSVDFAAYRYYLGKDFASTQIERVFNIRDCELRVWEEPLPWARYVIGCDPAYGRSDWNDSHAISIWRCFSDKLIQVAEYGSTEPETFQVTWALAHLASRYEDCYVNFEVSGPGIAIKTELDRMRQILRSSAYAEIVKAKGWENVLEGIKWYLYHRPDSLGKGFAFGWKSNVDNKIAIMNEVRDSYINDILIVRSSQVLEQMQYIVQDGADIGPAARGRSHDDFVFGSAFAHRAWLEWVRPSMIEENYSYARAMIEDEKIMRGERPSMVAGMVATFFNDRAQERMDAADHPWARERGLR